MNQDRIEPLCMGVPPACVSLPAALLQSGV